MRIFKADRIVLLNYGLPLLVILISITITLSPILQKNPELATAITYDLVLTAPLLFLLIAFKSKISKLSAIPFFIGGIVIATFLIPKNGQEHLSYLKSYLLPIVELFIFTFLLIKIRKGIKTFRANSSQTSDFHSLSKTSAQELFGKSRYATLFASEITMMYYAFFRWKRNKLKTTEFTKYKENASLALAGAFLLIIFIETYTFHVLLMKWSMTTAWILTIVSIYSAFSIIAHIKALLMRPSILTDERLILKNGLIADISIDLIEIAKIQGYSKEMNSEVLKIGNLGISKESTNHNIAIHFSTPQKIEKIYGFTEKCDVLLVHMDDRQRFLTEVNKRLDKLSN